MPYIKKIELKGFKFGTMEIIHSCAESNAFVVVGGGHTATLINNLGLAYKGLKEYEKSLDYYLEASKMANNIENKY